MPKISYQNFDLAFETIDLATARFRARVLQSPAGDASGEFTLPFTDLECENYILKLGRARGGVRSLNSAEEKTAREFGSKLYDCVFQGAIRNTLQKSLKQMQHAPRQGLRLRLHLAEAHSLIDLPWEFLYDPENRRFFSHSNITPIIRFMAFSDTVAPLPVTPPFKVLVMIAKPKDLPGLNVEAEWTQIENALSQPKQRGIVEITRLEKASLPTLQAQLRQGEYHIFHFVGHGGFDVTTESSLLMFEDESGTSHPVAGDHLGALLRDHPSLRLVLLNACEGARTGRTDPFAGVAQHLVQQGLPAVIAMQFAISDKAAIILAQELYKALADRYSIDAALAEARKAIFTENNDIEWGTPVLYMRTPDGRMFDTTIMPRANIKPKVPKPSTLVRNSVLHLQLESTEIAVLPGGEVQLRTMIANHGKESQVCKVKLTGIPAEWVTMPSGELLELKSPDVRTANIIIRPPASPKTRAGRFRVYVEVTSLPASRKPLRVKATLKIGIYGEIKSELTPNRAQVGETFELVIRNRRNQPEQVKLTCQDQNDQLTFQIPSAQTEIPAGESRVLKFSAQLRQSRWFGGRKEHPFTAKIETRGHRDEIHHGTVISWGLIRIPS